MTSISSTVEVQSLPNLAFSSSLPFEIFIKLRFLYKQQVRGENASQKQRHIFPSTLMVQKKFGN